MKPSIGVVIPNYNGANLLPRYLPSVLESGVAASVDKFVIVDDASTDNSLDILDSLTSDVRVVCRKENGGFGEAVNTGVSELDTDLLAICMTDIELQKDTIRIAAQAFERDDVWAVAFNLKTSDDSGNAGITGLPFRRGFFHTTFPDSEEPGHFMGKLVNVAFATGGAMLVRRDRFNMLGGFDRVYAPYMWEDVDICWRAWQRGWRSVCHNGAVAMHRHPHVTVESNAKQEQVERVLWRNRILFVRRNFGSFHVQLYHRIWLKLILFKSVARNSRTIRDAYVEARPNSRLNQESFKRHFSDRELMKVLETPFVLEK